MLNIAPELEAELDMCRACLHDMAFSVEIRLHSGSAISLVSACRYSVVCHSCPLPNVVNETALCLGHGGRVRLKRGLKTGVSIMHQSRCQKLMEFSDSKLSIRGMGAPTYLFPAS